MAIQQQLLVALSETGKRDQNEDFIVPNSIEEATHVYVVCDGVGGNHKGEIASKIVAESIEFYLKKKDPFLFQNKVYLNNSLSFAEERLSEYIESHPESRGMASTVACLEFIGKKAMGYWVGDTKIFQIRKGKVIFESVDHSLYEELKDHTSEEELKNIPLKNYILRAIKGNHHPTQAEHFIQKDIEEGDFFVLATDGITETFTGELLAEYISQYENSASILKEKILEACTKNSKDNFSIQIINILAIK